MQDKQASDSLTSQLINDLLKEKRRDRYWKNMRFFLGILLFMIFTGLTLVNMGSVPGFGDGSDYLALIRMNGIIEAGRDFSAEQILPNLKNVFADKNAKGVIIAIDSGGGSPVQASIIHDEIIRLKRQYHKRVVVVGEDMLASGAYLVAVAADKIYVNANTLTGSIGVIMETFGFPDLMQKVGIERRVYTSGTDKDRLDPFLPQNKNDIQKIQQVINEVHENFNHAVLEGRKNKLHGKPEQLFSGDFWSGSSALQLGLVDDIGNLSDAMQKEFHVSRYKDYSLGTSFFKSLLNQMGVSLNLALHTQQVKMLEKI